MSSWKIWDLRLTCKYVPIRGHPKVPKSTLASAILTHFWNFQISEKNSAGYLVIRSRPLSFLLLTGIWCIIRNWANSCRPDHKGDLQNVFSKKRTKTAHWQAIWEKCPANKNSILTSNFNDLFVTKKKQKQHIDKQFEKSVTLTKTAYWQAILMTVSLNHVVTVVKG